MIKSLPPLSYKQCVQLLICAFYILLPFNWTLTLASENIEAEAMLLIDGQAAEEAAAEAAEKAAEEAAEAAQKAAEQAAQEAEEAAEEAAEQAVERAAEEAEQAADQAVEQAAQEAEEAAEEAAEQAAEQAAEEAEQAAEEAAEQAAEEAEQAAEEAAEQAAEEAEEETEEAAERVAEDAEEEAGDESDYKFSSEKQKNYIANLSAERIRILDESFRENGIEAIDNEMLVLTDDDAELNIQSGNYKVEEQIYLEGLDLVLTRIRTPEDVKISRSLKEVSQNLEKGDVDLNHIYELESDELPKTDTVFKDTGFSSADTLSSDQTAYIKLGLIDTQINQTHSALINQHIITKDFVPYEGVRPEIHGTSVASIMVGNEPEIFSGIISDATLYTASVFFTMPSDKVAATTESLILALDWLVQQNVPIINMSLSGPENKLLEIAIARVMEKGIIIVAAVGNSGPNAPPLYPAAYEGVVAVTAVDNDHQIYLRANRGHHVTFAALGVDILAARAGGGYHTQTGTSIAAPFVSSILANLASTTQNHAYLQKLKENTIDLGPPGFDNIYGYGLIQAEIE